MLGSSLAEPAVRAEKRAWVENALDDVARVAMAFGGLEVRGTRLFTVEDTIDEEDETM